MGDTNRNYAATQLALPISLLRTREMVVERFRPMIASRGLTDQQWRVLRVLGEKRELDATHLAEQACLLMPSLTRIGKSLGTAGLVESKKDPNDRRRVLFSITAQGDELLTACASESAQIYAEIEEAIGAERLTSLLEDLVRVREALRK